MKLRILVGAVVALLITQARADHGIQAFHYAPKLESELGFSRAVRAGNTLYVAGSVGRGTMPEAIKEAYARIEATLRAHALDFSAVVKENIFTTDLTAFRKSNEIRKSYYKSEYPASTWVQVEALNAPELVLEVEVVAVFPDDH
jgi:enamine deaminase RidA (YjgF/YER057c/UK114 family)